MAENILDVLRTEQKYLVTCYERERLRAVLGGCLAADEHNGVNGYLVRSLYFDSLYDRDYMDMEGGFELRRKLRLRIYSPQDETAKLELKEKQGDYQRKRSLPISREDAIALGEGDIDILSKYPGDFALEIRAMMSEQQYRPKCIVEYDRLAYIVPSNDIRITFDSNLRASEAGLSLFGDSFRPYPVMDYNSVTMEVKFNHFLFSYIKDLLSLSDRSQCSSSKYCAARMMTLGAEL